MATSAGVKGVNLKYKISLHNIKHHIDITCLVIDPCVQVFKCPVC